MTKVTPEQGQQMKQHKVTTLMFSLAILASVGWCPGQTQSAAKPRLASTPPMGWNSWEAFRKDVDEDAVKAQADAMVRLGFRDAGYLYIVIDGGWKTSRRDAAGNLVADPKKFPHGIQSLAAYIHGRGLKFGLHQPAGIKDCGHDEPGSQNNEDRDAALFASWGVDFIKYDQCDYIHDPKMTSGAPDLDKIVVRKDDRVVFATEAEAPQNRLTGMAKVESCPRCSGQKSVTGIGYSNGAVEVDARVPESGQYLLDVHIAYPYYGQNRDRFKQMTLFVTTNGGSPQHLDKPYNLSERYTTGTISTSVELTQGKNIIRFDNPWSQEEDVRLSYLKMAGALQRSGREIMFSTSGAPRPWLWAQPAAQLYRTAGDISNRWTSIMNILDRHAETLRFAAPGFWPDPDMLEVGAPSRKPRTGNAPLAMSVIEQRSQFSLWAIMNAPLFISADLGHLDDQVKSILLNRDVIAINQDPLAAPGERIRSDGELQVFAKRLKEGEAVALLNRSEVPAEIRVTAAELGLDKATLKVRDLWISQSQRIPDGIIRATVEPHGVKLFRIRPVAP